MTQTEQVEGKPRLGRKRDHTRDPEILDAALDVLSETGYDGMTIDMVAARAKAGKATLYRRWPSKAELVLDAVVCMKSRDIDLAALPDTGTLRGDLVAMIRPPSIRDSERKLKVMAGIASMIARSPELASGALSNAARSRRTQTSSGSARSARRWSRTACSCWASPSTASS
jgi:AcrR family transcriptional regulator